MRGTLSSRLSWLVVAVATVGIGLLVVRAATPPALAASAATAVPAPPRVAAPAIPVPPRVAAPAVPAVAPLLRAYTVTVTNADLTKAAGGAFPQTMDGVTVSDPSVRIEGAQVRLTASARILFGTTEFALIATPTVTDGRVLVRVDSATLAGMSLPESTRASIADTVRGTLTRFVPGNVRVTTLTFGSGMLTIQGTQP